MPDDAFPTQNRAMTAGADELTAPATQPAGQLRMFIDALGNLGYDVESLLGRAGLRRADLDDPDAMVPCAALGVVFCGALEQRRAPNLAAHVAFHTPLGAYPLLDYLVATTDTVGDALRQLERYFHITAAPLRLEIVEDTASARLLVQPGTDPFAAQYETAIVIHHLREETEQRLRVSFVSLMREPDDLRDLERLLGCPVRAPATWSGIEFPLEAMRVPLRRRDPVLRRVLEGQVTGAPPATAANGGVVARVRTLLAARIGRGVPAISEVARRLAMAPRTLQRRLAVAGVSYKMLIDLARRDVAERLLGDHSLAVAEVGYLLGFSEPSAFHRAFKRWLGVTPLDYRRTVAAQQSRERHPVGTDGGSRRRM